MRQADAVDLLPNRRRHPRRPGHVVVRGVLGDGVRIVEELRQAGARVVAVDQSPTRSAAAGSRSRGAVPVRRPGCGGLLAAGIDGAVALICVEGDDLHNLATALVARELRPELRIVVGLRNAAVGRALNDIGVFVVDVGQVSAPSVIEACLRTRSHELSLGEDSYLVTEVPCERSGTLAELYGDLAVLAVRPGGGRAAEVAPADDRPMEVGDVDVVVGRADAIRDRGLGPRPLGEAGPAFVGARAPRESGPRPTTLLRHLVTDVDRRLTAVVLGLVGLIVVSVTVLLTGYRDADGSRMSLLDALYFTVETIGTVGFGDFYFRDQSAWLRGWAIALMVFGAGMVTLFFALLTNALISRTIAQSLGRRRVTGLSDHVVIVGLGSVGIAVADGLRVRARGVVIEADEENRFLSRSAPADAGDHRRRDGARDVRDGPARARPRGGRADQRRPDQYRSRAGGTRTARRRAGGTYRSCSGSSTTGWRRRWRPASTSGTSVPPLRSPHRGSSGPHSGWTCSVRSTSVRSPCWWSGW